MYSALDIAKFFITSDEDGVTNLKLQKLLYYAQGSFIVAYDRVLFRESIEAWPYGPVVSEVYNVYKKYGSEVIPEGDRFTGYLDMLKEEKSMLSQVQDLYGGYTTWKLSEMSHEDEAWKKNAESRCVISYEDLKEQFKERVES